MDQRTGDKWSWKPWISDWDDFPVIEADFPYTHQPLVADIEFVDDDMVVSFLNRGSEMWGNSVPAPFYS